MQVKADRGGEWFESMLAEVWNQEWRYHKGQHRRGDVERGERGTNRRGKRRKKRARVAGIQGMRGTLESRSRATRKRAQRREVEDGGSGSLYMWTDYPRM